MQGNFDDSLPGASPWKKNGFPAGRLGGHKVAFYLSSGVSISLEPIGKGTFLLPADISS
jgi:hypothetical protein